MRAITTTVIAVLAIGLLAVPAAAAGPSTAWTRQLGTSGQDEARAVAIDDNRNIYVVEWTAGTLPGQTNKGGIDAFLRVSLVGTHSAGGQPPRRSSLDIPTAWLALSLAVDQAGYRSRSHTVAPEAGRKVVTTANVHERSATLYRPLSSS